MRLTAKLAICSQQSCRHNTETEACLRALPLPSVHMLPGTFAELASFRKPLVVEFSADRVVCSYTVVPNYVSVSTRSFH